MPVGPGVHYRGVGSRMVAPMKGVLVVEGAAWTAKAAAGAVVGVTGAGLGELGMDPSHAASLSRTGRIR